MTSMKGSPGGGALSGSDAARSEALPAPAELDRVHHRPTRFYTVRRLAELAAHAIGVDVFQGFLDKRELQRPSAATVFGNDLPRKQVTIDYLADTGDGFNATYSVLHSLNPTSEIAFGEDPNYVGHGSMLIFGGDQVYPVPTPDAYEQRLTQPLADAVPDTPTGRALTELNRANLFPTAMNQGHIPRQRLDATATTNDIVDQIMEQLHTNLCDIWPEVRRCPTGTRAAEAQARAVADILEGMLLARHVFDAYLFTEGLLSTGRKDTLEGAIRRLEQRLAAPASLDLLLAYEIWKNAAARQLLLDLNRQKESLREDGRDGQARAEWKKKFSATQGAIGQCQAAVLQRVESFRLSDPSHPRVNDVGEWEETAWLRWMRAEYNFTAPNFARPWLFAIPGNHDWYDGLTAFSRQFMQTGKQIGAWTTKQERSYWAIKLRVADDPEATEGNIKNWWLWGIDLSLDSHIDEPQLEYFRNLDCGESEPIILFAATPAWTYSDRDARSLYYFERKIILEMGRRLVMVVAGDRHYYMRREAPRDHNGQVRRQTPIRVTAGMGGSFTHPTHTEEALRDLWELSSKRDRQDTHPRRGETHIRPKGTARYKTVACYPSIEQSKRLTGFRRSISAAFRFNRSFLLIPAFISMAAAALLVVTTVQFSGAQTHVWQLGWQDVGRSFLISWPGAILVLLAAACWIAAEPDPGASHRVAQRVGWASLLWVLVSSAIVAAICLAAWSVRQAPLESLNDTFDGLLGLTPSTAETTSTSLAEWRNGMNILGTIVFSGFYGAVFCVFAMLIFFQVTIRFGMSVNAVAAWNLEARYQGVVRMTFASDSVVVTVMGIDEVPTSHSSRSWRQSADAGSDRSIRPIFEPTFPDLRDGSTRLGRSRSARNRGVVPRLVDRFEIQHVAPDCDRGPQVGRQP